MKTSNKMAALAATATAFLSSPLAAATPAYESIFAEIAATPEAEGVSVSFVDDTNGLANLYIRRNNTEQSVMECFTREGVPDGNFISVNPLATQASATFELGSLLACSVGLPPFEVKLSCVSDTSYEQSILGRNTISAFHKKTILRSEVHSSRADCTLELDDVLYDLTGGQIFRSVNTEISRTR
jgi:hypothetical protein